MSFAVGNDPQPEEKPSQRAEPTQAPSSTPPKTPPVRQTGTYYPDPYRQQPAGRKPVPTQKRGRGGCLLTLFITLLLVLVLVGVGLLLPPFSLLDRINGPQYTALDAANPSMAHPDGLALTIDPQQPGEDFAVALDSIPQVEFDEPIPASLTLKGPVYTLAHEGETPGVIALNVVIPNDAQPYDTLDLYGWDAASSEWTFIPSQLNFDETEIVTDLDYVPDRVAVFQTSVGLPLVTLPVDPGQNLTSTATSLASVVMPTGLHPTAEGTLDGGLPGNFQTGAGYSVFLTVRNFSDPNLLDVETVERILSSEGLLERHITELAACAVSCYQGNTPVDGIAIDYRGVSAEYREAFSRFVHELARSLSANRQDLIVVVPAANEMVGEPWDTGAYDWRAIGRDADVVQVRLGSNPVDYIPGGLVERMLRWGVGEISRYKLQVVLSTRSFRQVGEDAPSFVPIDFAEAVSALGNVEILTASDEHYFLPGTTIEAALNGYTATTGVDPEAHTPYIDFDSGAGRVWLATMDALLYRMTVPRQFNIGGVVLADLLSSGASPEAFTAASAFQQGEAPPDGDAVELALQWTVLSAAGDTIAEGTTGLGETFSWEAIEQDGNYAINVAVVSGSLSTSRAGQQISVAFPTNTPAPTPSPTATTPPTATTAPTFTPRAAAAQPTQAPAQGQAAQQPAQQQEAAPTQAPAQNPAPVVSGSIGGSFEIGGHVAGLGSAATAMQSAGMRWVKYQVRYSMGADPSAQAGQINEAHSLGFKILLGVVGDPGQLGSTPEDQYFADYARFVGGLAAMGADAIEVWNEMNIDREWPTGRIDPAMYVRMLAPAYNAIKSANGNTMVISGALAPTGAEGAFGLDSVWNDDRYYAGMAAAGAAQYADCIGAHYNEGIVPPDQVGNDPRGDSYPTRFLSTMTDRAWAPFGGQRPVCYTELGYLTPEGYGQLPGGFAWAQNVTLAQQAAWLANAAVINSNSGKVRLMIIWNVNFTNWGADPMAGYAIIRADGNCPACQTLGQVAR